MDGKKRILMIADVDSFWTRRLMEHLLLPAGYELVLFPIWGDGGKYADFYRANGVTVYHDRHTLPVIRHIPRLRMWARIALNARDLKRLGPFDIVHNHYLSQRDLALGRLVQPFGLSDNARADYELYLTAHPADAFKLAIDTRDEAALRLLVGQR